MVTHHIPSSDGEFFRGGSIHRQGSNTHPRPPVPRPVTNTQEAVVHFDDVAGLLSSHQASSIPQSLRETLASRVAPISTPIRARFRLAQSPPPARITCREHRFGAHALEAGSSSCRACLQARREALTHEPRLRRREHDQPRLRRPQPQAITHVTAGDDFNPTPAPTSRCPFQRALITVHQAVGRLWTRLTSPIREAFLSLRQPIVINGVEIDVLPIGIGPDLLAALVPQSVVEEVPVSTLPWSLNPFSQPSWDGYVFRQEREVDAPRSLFSLNVNPTQRLPVVGALQGPNLPDVSGIPRHGQRQ